MKIKEKTHTQKKELFNFSGLRGKFLLCLFILCNIQFVSGQIHIQGGALFYNAENRVTVQSDSTAILVSGSHKKDVISKPKKQSSTLKSEIAKSEKNIQKKIENQIKKNSNLPKSKIYSPSQSEQSFAADHDQTSATVNVSHFKYEATFTKIYFLRKIPEINVISKKYKNDHKGFLSGYLTVFHTRPPPFLA